MAIDVRANMVCNLGTVISGEVSDDLLQEGGLIRTSGSLVLDGIVMPARGAEVQLAYERPHLGTITRFPRALRVLKATADPYRRKTTVDVGCKLTLMAGNASGSATIRASNSPSLWYQILTAGDQRLVAPTIDAQAVLGFCLAKIRMALAAGAEPLQFKFLRESIDLSNGYVSVINDLIKSECCIGYLNLMERLVIEKVNLTAPGSAGVLTDADLIDLEPIAGATEPGDKVLVSFYATRR